MKVLLSEFLRACSALPPDGGKLRHVRLCLKGCNKARDWSIHSGPPQHYLLDFIWDGNAWQVADDTEVTFVRP